MEQIDFYKKKRDLHNEILKAISDLFEKAGISEIDFKPNYDWQQNAYVILSPDGASSTYETEVLKVKCDDGWIFISIPDCDDWISCDPGSMVVSCSIETLYDAVYDYVSNINRTYYVCELDVNGEPTGNVVKHTWRIEHAENMMEQRGHIYLDLKTAISNARRSKVKKM